MRYSGGFTRLGDDEVEGERENEESDEPVDIDNPPTLWQRPWSPTLDSRPAPRTISINGSDPSWLQPAKQQQTQDSARIASR
jgi:hypothetical protein